MLGANKAQVIIRHVVYVGHCQVLAKKTKENKLTPARSWMRNCNPFSKREMCLTSFWSPEGLGVLTCKQRGMSMTPFPSVSEQEISLFRKKKSRGTHQGKQLGDFSLIPKLQVFVFCHTAELNFGCTWQPQRGTVAISGGRKQLQEFKVLTKGNSRCVLPILLGHKAFFQMLTGR